MSQPRITVIINTYNQKEYIARAITSVLGQTLQPLQIIVIDDGSSDGTEELVRQEFGNRVVYHRQANRGISNARNTGIRMSSGDWIALLDSDDYWTSDKLELQAAAIGSVPNLAMIVCDGVECTPDGILLDELTLPQPLTRDVVRDRLKRRCTFTTSGVMIRRDALLHVCGFPEDLAFGEDWVCFAQIAALYEVVAVHRPLFHKTQLLGGLGSQPQAALRDGLIALRRSTDALASHSWPQSWRDSLVFRQSVAQLCVHAAWLYGRRHHRWKAIETLTKGLVHWPFLTYRQYRSVYWLCVNLVLGFD